MDAYRYLCFLGVCISYVLNKPLYNSCTKLLAFLIRGLVRFMKVKNYMEHLSLNNKYLPFLGEW